MKSIFFAIALICGLSFNHLSAADIKVPAGIAQSFEASFPKAESVSWMENEYFIIASFSEKGKVYSAYYSKDGELVVVAEVITLSQLPKALAKHFEERVSGGTSAHFYRMNAGGEVTYFCDVEKEGKRILYSSVGRKWGLMLVRQ